MKDKVHVLGVEYAIEERSRESDSMLRTVNGYVDSSVKLIVICEPEQGDFVLKNTLSYSNKVLRHEIIHAFLNESGLDYCSMVFDDGWATNEEMVDWFAIQSPKIFEAFTEAECL